LVRVAAEKWKPSPSVLKGFTALANQMPDVLIITVNYRGAEATEAFVQSASVLDGFDLAHIIVVENGSHDGSVERLEPLIRGLDNVELMESAENRGYFGAANWALQQYLARGRKPSWVIVCNNDVVFDDHQFLAKLLQRDLGAAQVIAPAIIARPTGIDCNPFMRKRPSPFKLLRCRFWQSKYYLMWFKQWLSPYVRTARHRLHFTRRSSIPVGRTAVYAPHGSFLIFSRSYFDAGGYIDDGFFLFAEEFSVAEICRQLHLRVVHDPDLRVWHDAHKVTGRMCNRITFEYARQGLEYALRKYFLATKSRESQPLHENAAVAQADNSPRD
jgi:GT2 family glycosyltransferase